MILYKLKQCQFLEVCSFFKTLSRLKEGQSSAVAVTTGSIRILPTACVTSLPTATHWPLHHLKNQMIPTALHRLTIQLRIFWLCWNST